MLAEQVRKPKGKYQMKKYAKGLADIHHNLRKILKGRRRGMLSWELCLAYQSKFGRRYSDASITARLREMADIECNLSTYRYTIRES